MNFKVGQRVRVIAVDSVNYGREGSITGPILRVFGLWDVKTDRPRIQGCDAYPVLLPGHPPPWADSWHYVPEDLAPLTDPKAEQFIERVKSWKPEPVIPLPVKTYADIADTRFKGVV